MSNVTGPSKSRDFESLPEDIQTQFKNAQEEIQKALSSKQGVPAQVAAKLFSKIFSEIDHRSMQDRSLQNLDAYGITKNQLAQILQPRSNIPAFSQDEIKKIAQDVYENYPFPQLEGAKVPHAPIKETLAGPIIERERTITQLQQTIQQLQGDYASLKQRGIILTGQQQERIASLKVQIDQFLQYDFPQLAKEREKGDETIHQLRSQVQEMQKTISDFSEQIEKATSEKEQYLNAFLKLQSTTKELDKQIKNKDETIQQFRTTITALQNDYKTLTEQKKLTDDQGKNLLNKINDLTKKCDTLEKQATLNAQDLTAFNNDANELRALIALLKKEIADLTATNKKLWATNSKLLNENKTLSFENKSLKIMFLIQIVIVGLFLLMSREREQTFFPV